MINTAVVLKASFQSEISIFATALREFLNAYTFSHRFCSISRPVRRSPRENKTLTGYAALNNHGLACTHNILLYDGDDETCSLHLARPPQKRRIGVHLCTCIRTTSAVRTGCAKCTSYTGPGPRTDIIGFQ